MKEAGVGSAFLHPVWGRRRSSSSDRTRPPLRRPGAWLFNRCERLPTSPMSGGELEVEVRLQLVLPSVVERSIPLDIALQGRGIVEWLGGRLI